MAIQRRQQWLRGVLDLCVLGTLVESEAHGYAIAQRLGAAGLGDIQGGTLYPILARLAAAGFVSARWQEGDRGPGRKDYALTAAGRDELRNQGEAWRAFVRSVDGLVDPSAAPPEHPTRTSPTENGDRP